MVELGMYMGGYPDVEHFPSRGGWATPHGADECTTCVVQTETLTGFKLGARFREVLHELKEPYILTDGVGTTHIWVRPGIWEVFETYWKPGNFRFAGLSLEEYMRAMLK